MKPRITHHKKTTTLYIPVIYEKTTGRGAVYAMHVYKEGNKNYIKQEPIDIEKAQIPFEPTDKNAEGLAIMMDKDAAYSIKEKSEKDGHTAKIIEVEVPDDEELYQGKLGSNKDPFELK